MILTETENFIVTEEQVIEIKFNKHKFDKSFSEFLKKYPQYVSTAVKLGTDAIQKYKTYKNSTARLYGRTPFEKSVNDDIVKILQKSGKFKLVTKKIKGHETFYELVRK